MALEFSLPQQWVFAALVGGTFPRQPVRADRRGLGRPVRRRPPDDSGIAGRVAGACCLRAGAGAHQLRGGADRDGVRLLLRALSTAFAAIVQIGPVAAQRSITHLTLIAGFASTLFWPLTSLLHEHLTWREVFVEQAGQRRA